MNSARAKNRRKRGGTCPERLVFLLATFFLSTIYLSSGCGQPDISDHEPEIDSSSQEPGAPSENEKPPKDELVLAFQNTPFLFSYSEENLDDASRAILTQIIARSRPISEWPRITVRLNDGLERIIDRYYDIYSQENRSNRFSRPSPRTTKAIVDLIKSANSLGSEPLQPEQMIHIPALPALPQVASKYEASMRYFDPESFTYGITSDRTINYFEDTAQGSVPVAHHLGRYRQAERTAVVLPATTSRADLYELSLLGHVESVTLGLGDRPTDIGDLTRTHVQMELLDTDPYTCQSPDSWLTNSPYWEVAKRRIAGAKARILARAPTRRLAIIDINFAAGHGAKVRDAAESLLISLELGDVIDHIVEFEMDPGRAEDFLTEAVKEYWENRQDDLKYPDLGPAFSWIHTAGKLSLSLIHSIPEVVIEAALFRHMSRGDFINLSWRLRQNAVILPASAEELLKNSLVIVAAGNEPIEISRALPPQDIASKFATFLNVTHGSMEGVTQGSRSRRDGGGLVDLIAPGCGYQQGHLAPENSGSSYASPYVAAAAWIKYLLDGTSTRKMRQELLFATRMISSQESRVEGGGFFDVARLFSQVGSHYIDRDNRLVHFDQGNLAAGSCGTFNVNPSKPQSFVVFRGPEGKLRLRWREASDRIPGGRIDFPRGCEINHHDFSFSYTTDGESISIGASEFVQNVRELYFE